MQDAPKADHPQPIGEEKEKEILKLVRTNHESREMTVAEIARHVGISSMTAHRRLKKHGFGRYKPTYRPGTYLNFNTTYLQSTFIPYMQSS